MDSVIPMVFMSCGEVRAEQHLRAWRASYPGEVIHLFGQASVREAHLNAARTLTDAGYADTWMLICDADTVPHPVNYSASALHLPTPGMTRVQIWNALNPVTGLVSPHGGLKLMRVDPAWLQTEQDKLDVSRYVGYQVSSDPIPYSVEHFNQSPRMAFTAAYKDVVLLTRDFSGPNGYIQLENLDALSGKRRRIWNWLAVGADSEYGCYSLYGAHLAFHHVYTRSVPSINWKNYIRELGQGLPSEADVWRALQSFHTYDIVMSSSASRYYKRYACGLTAEILEDPWK